MLLVLALGPWAFGRWEGRPHKQTLGDDLSVSMVSDLSKMTAPAPEHSMKDAKLIIGLYIADVKRLKG